MGHSIVLRRMREALEEAIVKDRVSDLDWEVASFMRSLRLLGVGVCREILDRDFPASSVLYHLDPKVIKCVSIATIIDHHKTDQNKFTANNQNP